MRTKIFLFLILLLPAANSYCQVVELNGKITAENLEGSPVHILNLSEHTGALSKPGGEFQIAVKEKDTLLFSSLKYKKLQVIVSAEMIKNLFLEILLEEAINELAEVKIQNIDLTGNLSADISSLRTGKLYTLKGRFSDNKYADFDADLLETGGAPLDLASGENRQGEGESIVKLGIGVDVIGKFLGIYKKSYTPNLADEIAVELRNNYDPDFFISQLKLPENEIPEFINYLVAGNFTARLLEKQNKLALLEFMIEKSEQYKRQILRNYN